MRRRFALLPIIYLLPIAHSSTNHLHQEYIIEREGEYPTCSIVQVFDDVRREQYGSTTCPTCRTRTTQDYPFGVTGPKCCHIFHFEYHLGIAKCMILFAGLCYRYINISRILSLLHYILLRIHAQTWLGSFMMRYFPGGCSRQVSMIACSTPHALPMSKVIC